MDISLLFPTLYCLWIFLCALLSLYFHGVTSFNRFVSVPLCHAEGILQMSSDSWLVITKSPVGYSISLCICLMITEINFKDLESLILGWSSNQLIFLVEDIKISVSMVLSCGIGQVFYRKILESSFWNIKWDYKNSGCCLRKRTWSEGENLII